MAFGAVVSLTAVLLVFQSWRTRIFFAMARDGLLAGVGGAKVGQGRPPHITTVMTGLAVAVGDLVADENEIYDLTNIGTLSAFVIVCIGVLVLRSRSPTVPGHSKCRSCGSSACGRGGCFYTMRGLPRTAWDRFGIWLSWRCVFRAFTVIVTAGGARSVRLKAGPKDPAYECGERLQCRFGIPPEFPTGTPWPTTGLRCVAPASTT